MKCPKCGYLGFETGDRCKNCGYDFSLIPVTQDPAPAADAVIRREPASLTPEKSDWLDRLDRTIAGQNVSIDADMLIGAPDTTAAPTMSPAPPAPALPLFTPGAADDDTPLITMPRAPRPPLAVRRTPDAPRLRAVPRATRGEEPALDFRNTAVVDELDEMDGDDATPEARAPRPRPRTPYAVGTADVRGRRAFAAAIDHLILFSIDLTVVYFTLRMAGLTPSDAGMLPAGPLFAFLFLVKVAYFSAFTAVGGQTIGKMAVGIRVVSDDDHAPVDGGRAVSRTLGALLSVATAGLGFLPAFVGSDRRALHDRLAHTRVVSLPQA